MAIATPSPSLYTKLNLSQDASPEQIDATFLRLALQAHPLKHPGDTGMQQRYAQLGNAYFVLGSVAERARYDATLAAGTPYRPSQAPPTAAIQFDTLFRTQAQRMSNAHQTADALCAALLALHYPATLARQLADELLRAEPVVSSATPVSAVPAAPTPWPAWSEAPVPAPRPTLLAKPQAAPQAYQPYAPPQSSTEPIAGEQVWVEGRDVVIATGSDFPHRCVYCNEAVSELPKTRTYYWHSPWYYLLFFINLLILLIVALIVRKKVQVSPALCRRHQKRRNWLILGLWGSVLLEAGALAVSAMHNDTMLLMLGIFGVLITSLVAIAKAPLLRTTRIERGFSRFRGAGKAFLESLPAR